LTGKIGDRAAHDADGHELLVVADEAMDREGAAEHAALACSVYGSARNRKSQGGDRTWTSALTRRCGAEI
jgi:hypothetical protein